MSDEDHLLSILKSLSLEKFYPTFKENDIDEIAFLQLEDKHLIELGLSIGARAKIEGYIKKEKERQEKEPLKDSGHIPKEAKALLDDVAVYGVTIDKLIGQGNFGKVYRGMYGSNTIAAKLLRDQMDTLEFLKEAKVLKELRHPNIITFYGIFEGKWIILELMEGSLDSFLKKYGTAIPLDYKIRMMKEICSGMLYVSKKNILHLDLAARNVLHAGEVPNLKLKITDFGLSRSLSSGEEYYGKLEGKSFPLAWTAVEILRKQKATKESDVWSFGILMYEIISNGLDPYPGILPIVAAQMVMQGHRMKRHDDCPEALYTLMTRCWAEDYKARPPFEELLDQLTSFEKAPPSIPPPQQVIKEEDPTFEGYGEAPRVEAEKYVWFEEPDDGNLVIKNNELSCASLRKVVELIWRSPPSGSDSFENDLLLGYSIIIAPTHFLDILFSAYEKQKDPNHQLKLLMFLNKWIALKEDQNEEWYAKLGQFIQTVKRGQHKDTGNILEKNLKDKKLGILEKLTNDAPPPPPILPKKNDYSLLNIDPLEIARQITLRNFEAHLRVRHPELLKFNSLSQRKELTPNLLQFATDFNRISNWVSVVILSEGNLKKRAQTFTHLVNVAEHLKKLGNFFGIIAIMSGLSHSAVFRLRKTSEELPKSTNKALSELRTFTSSEKSWKTYRAAEKATPLPLIPFIGVYQSDLTFISEGNPDFVGTLHNLRKLQMIGRVLRDYLATQKKAYNIVPVPYFQDYLQKEWEKAEKIKDNELYEMSIRIEPRAKTVL